MSDYNEMVRFLKSPRPTCILKCPSGRFALVGSVPVQLTKPSNSPFSPDPVSLVWDTEREAMDALLSIGINRFQRADCSWYDKSAE
jgi:hypothetical protein